MRKQKAIGFVTTNTTQMDMNIYPARLRDINEILSEFADKINSKLSPDDLPMTCELYGYPMLVNGYLVQPIIYTATLGSTPEDKE